MTELTLNQKIILELLLEENYRKDKHDMQFKNKDSLIYKILKNRIITYQEISEILELDTDF